MAAWAEEAPSHVRDEPTAFKGVSACQSVQPLHLNAEMGHSPQERNRLVMVEAGSRSASHCMASRPGQQWQYQCGLTTNVPSAFIPLLNWFNL